MPNINHFEFALLLGDIAPTIEDIDGRLFLDRDGEGLEALKAEIAKYADPREAQKWINMAPIDDLIDSAVGNWSMEDETIEQIVDIYRRSWLAIVHAKFGAVSDVSVELLMDEEAGDVIIQLQQE